MMKYFLKFHISSGIIVVLSFSPFAFAQSPNKSGNPMTTATNENISKLISPSENLKKELEKVGVAKFTNSKFKQGTVRHIVSFRYKDHVTKLEKNEVKRHFLELKKLANRNGSPYIASIETGLQTSGEGFEQQFEQIFIVTFHSEGDRNYYIGEPIIKDKKYYDAAHQKFKDFAGPFLREPINTGVAVFDFTVEK